jgi:uncharacterized membrane protein
MKAQIPTNYHRVGEQPPRPFRSLFLDSVRYWEPRRVIYNFALAAVSVGWVFVSWPHFRPALNLSALIPLSVLALLANLCYCAAYIVDIPLQLSVCDRWREQRWVLWMMGMLFAIVVTSYWINDEIYPAIR